MTQSKRNFPKGWRTLPIADRLSYLSEQVGDCLVWTGATNRWGYGRCRVNGQPSRAAHVVAWETYNNRPVPQGMVVRHRCDNPPCIRRDHLEIGTTADNNRDRAERLRSCKGEQHHSARLTETQVLEIRDRAHSGSSIGSLAAEFSVHYNTIDKIVRRQSWGWLNAPTAMPKAHRVALDAVKWPRIGGA